MRFAAFILMLCLISTTVFGAVQDRKLGAGLMIGSLTSVTGKYWLSQGQAVDFGVGFGSHSTTALYADYLWHTQGVFGRGTQFGRETLGYLGAGAGVGFWNDSYECGHWSCDRRIDNSGTGVFLRGLAGMEWMPSNTRFGVFAEIGPTLLVTPKVSGSLDLGLGGRYYF